MLVLQLVPTMVSAIDTIAAHEGKKPAPTRVGHACDTTTAWAAQVPACCLLPEANAVATNREAQLHESSMLRGMRLCRLLLTVTALYRSRPA